MAPPFQVGDTFSLVRTCDPYRSLFYAGASLDFNPVHIDPEVGRRAGFSGVILQGMCTLSWAVDAVVRHVGAAGRVCRVRTRFSRPVEPGDVITLRGRVSALEGARLRAEVAATNQRGEDVLQGALVEVELTPS